jgi:hypothetical protein
LQLVDSIPLADQSIFAQAKRRWESVITGDLDDVDTLGGTIFAMTYPQCTVPNRIDDLYICALYQPIDGNKNIVGLAGPTYNRQRDGTTVVGEMEFDVADVDFLQASGSSNQEKGGGDDDDHRRNNFMDTILHEMGHVLGKRNLS